MHIACSALAHSIMSMLVPYNVQSVNSVVAVGYSHRRTLGFKEGFSTEDNEEIEGGSKTYVFRLQP